MGAKWKPNRGIEQIIKNAIVDGLKDAGEVGAKKVSDLAPKKTGKLKKSIKSQVDSEELKLKISSDVPYADEVELGTFKMTAQPFMRPGIKSAASKMLKQFKDLF